MIHLPPFEYQTRRRLKAKARTLRSGLSKGKPWAIQLVRSQLGDEDLAQLSLRDCEDVVALNIGFRSWRDLDSHFDRPKSPSPLTHHSVSDPDGFFDGHETPYPIPEELVSGIVWTNRWDKVDASGLEFRLHEPGAHVLPQIVRDTIDEFGRPQSKHDRDFRKQPLGEQVRIVRIVGKTVHVVPSRFVEYWATHQRLWLPSHRRLREAVRRNAVHGLADGDPLFMPSTMAIALVFITSDNRLLIRKRRSSGDIWPGAWEAHMGEMLHGPTVADHPHFLDGLPSMKLYLKNAVLEETGEAPSSDDYFGLHGFYVEKLSLAPKLRVVHQSQRDSEAVAEGSMVASDKAEVATTIELTPSSVARFLADRIRYPVLTPGSRDAAMHALEFVAGPQACREVEREVGDWLVRRPHALQSYGSARQEWSNGSGQTDEE